MVFMDFEKRTVLLAREQIARKLNQNRRTIFPCVYEVRKQGPQNDKKISFSA
jgi:hypothetical protein